MRLDVNCLRRRPAGPRVLAYLDQSTVSELARNDTHTATRELLQDGVKAGKLVCPESLGHTDEALGAPQSWQDILELQDELSMGISFRDEKQTVQHETISAAAEYSGEPSPFSLAEEAFHDDPHAPRDELYAGGIRIRVQSSPWDFLLAEVDHEKGKEAPLQAAYDAARELGRTFEEQAELELQAMVNWVLGRAIVKCCGSGSEE